MVIIEKENFPCRRFVLRVSVSDLIRQMKRESIRIDGGRQIFKNRGGGRSEKVRFYCTQEEFEQFWKTYFDLDTCYADYLSLIKDDEYLKRAAGFGSGIRILQQDLWEMIVTFILSQQSNIPRIKSMIQRISERYGDKKKPAKDMYIMHFREQSSLYRRPKKNFGRLSSVIEANIYAILRKWWQRELLILKNKRDVL